MSAVDLPRKPRVIFGTSGSHDYLKDTTGDRRYWVLPAAEMSAAEPFAVVVAVPQDPRSTTRKKGTA